MPAQSGIIPARAGSTVMDVYESTFKGDHPRSRGVYFRRVGFSSTTTGSSPLARGLRAITLTAIVV